jgi:polyhydroxyalkanoate synthesis repressor PhaR
MAKKTTQKGPIIVKKYANRRLYDTSTSSYVTLENLSDMVRDNVDFEVRDAKTSEDLTRQVLTQIIFEHETKGNGALPLNFLRQLIGFYGKGAQPYLPAWLDMSMNSFAQQQNEWAKSANPMSLFQKQAERNMAMFEGAMKMFMPTLYGGGTKTGPSAANGMANPQAEMMAMMQAQMAQMQEQLAELAKKN